MLVNSEGEEFIKIRGLPQIAFDYSFPIRLDRRLEHLLVVPSQGEKQIAFWLPNQEDPGRAQYAKVVEG